MSRRLAALTLALGILVCAMGLRTALNSNHSGSTVLVANGPDPLPPPLPPPPRPSPTR
jgi:hypothetical protein